MKRILSRLLRIVAAALLAAPALATTPPPIGRPPAVLPPPRLVVQGAEIPVRLESVSVTTQVAGRLAQTSVELVFFNPNARQLEGELHFPLLEGQEVTGFAMDFNGRLREAVPVAKSRGQAVFEDITRARVDPALAEKTVGNNFKLRVYPLPPRAKKIVVVRYQEALAERGGAIAYRLPLAYGERVDRFSWAGHIASGAAPRHLRGPLPEMKFIRAGGGYALQTEQRDVLLSGVVEITIPAHGEALATTQEFDGETYFYAEPAIAAASAASRPTPQRVAIYWDASGSGAERDHAREFAVLSAYFERFRTLAVTLVVFRDAAESPRSFAVANGDWTALRKVLGAVTYDGASNFAPLAGIMGVSEALLFSDGIANYGETSVPKSTTPIHAIVAASRSDPGFLRALAEQSGGRYADAAKLGSAGAAALLLGQSPRVTIESVEGVADALLVSPYAENGRVQLAGRLTEPEGRVVLRIAPAGTGAGSKGSTRTIIVQRGAGLGGFAALRWAALKVAALETDFALNRAQVERIGKRFRLITRSTSLIILDTARDYARFEIEPPAELRAEYEQLRAAGVRSAEANRAAHIERIVRQFQEKQAWWERGFPKGDRPVPALAKKEAAASGALALREEARQSERAAAPKSAPMQAAPAARPAPAPAPQMAARARGDASAAAAGSGEGIAIRLQPWSPDTPYARRLRDADAANLYRIYVDERPSHQNSTAFFLDVADLLLSKNEKALALRVLSNLAEMNLENRHILRILGYRLMQAGEPLAAVPVFKRVLELSPEEPQSWRDLGLAWAAAGQFQRAVDALAEVVMRPWNGRFPEVELIALAEANAIIAQSQAKLDPKLDLSRLDPRLVRNLPLDVRTVLSWDADNTDIDLHVTDPNGETAFYGNRLTYQGGRMSADFTGGYGPEEFSLKSAKPGKYRVEAQFYGHRQQVVADATTLMLRLTTGFGTPGARDKYITLRLKGTGSKVFVGEFEVGGP